MSVSTSQADLESAARHYTCASENLRRMVDRGRKRGEDFVATQTGAEQAARELREAAVAYAIEILRSADLFVSPTRVPPVRLR